MPSRSFGKATTAAMFLMLVVVAIRPDSEPITRGLFVLTASLSVVAAVDYFAVFLRVRRRDRRERAAEGDAERGRDV